MKEHIYLINCRPPNKLWMDRRMVLQSYAEDHLSWKGKDLVSMTSAIHFNTRLTSETMK